MQKTPESISATARKAENTRPVQESAGLLESAKRLKREMAETVVKYARAKAEVLQAKLAGADKGAVAKLKSKLEDIGRVMDQLQRDLSHTFETNEKLISRLDWQARHENEKHFLELLSSGRFKPAFEFFDAIRKLDAFPKMSLEYQLKEKIISYGATEINKGSGVEFVGSMSQGTPGAAELASLLYKKTLADIGPGADWEQTKTELMKRLADAPEALAEAANVNRWGSDQWSSDERLQVVRGLEARGKKDFIAMFDFGGFDEKTGDALAPLLMESYLEHQPRSIIYSIARLKDLYDKLPDEEKLRVLKSSLEGAHGVWTKVALLEKMQYLTLTPESYKFVSEKFATNGETLSSELSKKNPVALVAERNKGIFHKSEDEREQLLKQLIDEKPYDIIVSAREIAMTSEQQQDAVESYFKQSLYDKSWFECVKQNLKSASGELAYLLAPDEEKTASANQVIDELDKMRAERHAAQGLIDRAVVGIVMGDKPLKLLEIFKSRLEMLEQARIGTSRYKDIKNVRGKFLLGTEQEFTAFLDRLSKISGIMRFNPSDKILELLENADDRSFEKYIVRFTAIGGYRRHVSENKMIELLKNADDGSFEKYSDRLVALDEYLPYLPGDKKEEILDTADQDRFNRYCNRLAEIKAIIEVLPIDLKLELLETAVERRVESVVKRVEKMKPHWQLIPMAKMHEMLSYDEEKFDRYLSIVIRLNETPSQEMKHVGRELMGQLLEAEDPLAALEQIEKVFIYNNLPMVGKTFRVFEILHPKKKLDEKCSAEYCSPDLRHARSRERPALILQDLMQIHLRSGNRSFEEYLEALNNPLLNGIQVTEEPPASEQGMVWAQVPKVQVAEMTEADKIKFDKLIRKLAVMHEQSQLGRIAEDEADSFKGKQVLTDEERLEICTNLAKSLKLRKGQSMAQRVAEMFLKPLGYDTVGQALEVMKGARRGADKRGREYARKVGDGSCELKPGDLLKGVDSQYFVNYLQNGSVAQEYLGSSSGSDMTPLDTDMSRVMPEDEALDFQSAIKTSLAYSYGDMLIAVRDRGQIRATDQQTPRVRPGGDYKLELFATPVHGESHWGIRTGFPSTEIDYVVLKNPQNKNDFLLEIVKQGVYIPVLDSSGKIIFKPEDYDRMRRQVFAGLTRFGGPQFELSREFGPAGHEERLAEVAGKKLKEHDRVKAAAKAINRMVGKIVESIPGFRMFDPAEDRIDGVKLEESGSSRRFTNVPGSVDFDYIVRLDPNQMSRVDELRRTLRQAFAETGAVQNPAGEGPDQVRLVDATVAGQPGIEIDFTFISKSELHTYASHDAVAEKLKFVRKNYDRQTYERVLANIALTKEVLKEAHAYKKLDGGLGGIGVELWLMQNKGDMILAFKTFLAAATKEDGTQASFYEFQEKYLILDPGTNSKDGRHENFTQKISPAVYDSMYKMIKEYLG